MDLMIGMGIHDISFNKSVILVEVKDHLTLREVKFCKSWKYDVLRRVTLMDLTLSLGMIPTQQEAFCFWCRSKLICGQSVETCVITKSEGSNRM